MSSVDTMPFILTDADGEILGWADTLRGIIRRLRKCRAGGRFTLEIGGAKLTKRKTPMLFLLGLCRRFERFVENGYIFAEESGNSLLMSFPRKLPGSLELLCFCGLIFRAPGCEVIKHLDEMMLEIRRTHVDPPTA